MKNRLLFVTAILFMALRLSAQDFEIVGVESLPADMSAREEMKADHAERQCALLRIATQNIVPAQRELFTFKTDLGSELVERATRNGEIWLWVSPGLKYLRVMHRDLGQYELRLLDHVASIEALHTYKIVIRGTAPAPGPDPGNGGNVVVRQQYLVFRMTPPNAMLEVNGKLWEVNADGVAKQLVDFGTYSYRVQAPNYHSETSTVTVDDPDNAKTVVVNLKPDFVEVTLQVDADAEIWVNNEMKGTRTWKGRLGKGKYRIECKQANHETSMVSKEITDEMNGQTIVLNAPRPIYGALNVDATPDFCDIFIDGQKIGQTPKFISQLLVGRHELKLTKANYADYTETVTIAKGETKTVNATLSSTATVRFTCNAAGATLYVDGKALGSASGSYALGYGSHSLRATADGYDDYTGSFTVSPNNTNCTISMKAKLGPLTFTVKGITFKMLPVEGGTFTMGATAEQGSDAYSDEKPTHNVTLSSFYMGETEVTQELWQAVMGSNPSSFKGNNLPMESVSWNDCQTFINKLNQLLAGQLGGKRFALPTEAQWEYAARGGKKSRGYKYSGSNTLDNVAWYTSTTNDNGTKPVGTKQANELGLYDMSGNVYEWCSDWCGSYGSSAQTDPAGSTTGSFRVRRGGSWSYSARCCRVSDRNYLTPGSSLSYLGLRLAL